MTHHERNPLRYFFAPFFFIFGAIGVIFPFFSLWLKDWGLSDSQTAVILSMNGLAVIVWSQFWGYAGDMLLPRKYLMIFNAFAASLLFAFLPWTHRFLPLCLLAFAFASFLTPNSNLLNGLLLSQHRGESRYAVIRSLGSLGFIVVNLFIGAISTEKGTSVIFLFFGGTLGLFVISLLPIRDRPYREYREARRRARRSQKEGRREEPGAELAGHLTGRRTAAAESAEHVSFLEAQAAFWNRPAIRRFLIYVVVYQLAHALSHHFQGIRIRELGGRETTVSYAYAIAAGSELVLLWFVDRLLRNRSAVPYLVAAGVAQSIRWGLLFFFPVLWVTIGSNVFHALTFGLFYASGVVYIHRLSPRNLRTTGQTLYGLAYFGVAALGSNLLGSLVIERLDLHRWYGVASALALGAALIALTIPRDDLARADSG